MKAENVKKMRRLLVRSINAHLKRGGELISGAFERGKVGIDGQCYCPLTCLMGDKKRWGANQTYDEILSKKLGFKLKHDEMWEFVYGFDKAGPLYGNTAVYKLGQSLRTKYAKELGL